ncbi:hypothetical protein T4C_8942 [Trichinella pseudospiralis]|uniref:Uncharacterized protein n=1 Tax=Trichinella pseudospiralis TaxID=6337 RepID=A0A0V1JTR8_TRIPS|nr:hypothetical protein T4C_8942 [Trichinella pseudospiralis]
MDVTFSVTALNIWEDQEGQHHRKITNSKLTHTWLERYTVPSTVSVIKEASGNAPGVAQRLKKFAYGFRLCLQHSVAQYLPLGYTKICICKFFKPLGYAWGVA